MLFYTGPVIISAPPYLSDDTQLIISVGGRLLLLSSSDTVSDGWWKFYGIQTMALKQASSRTVKLLKAQSNLVLHW